MIAASPNFGTKSYHAFSLPINGNGRYVKPVNIKEIMLIDKEKKIHGTMFLQRQRTYALTQKCLCMCTHSPTYIQTHRHKRATTII